MPANSIHPCYYKARKRWDLVRDIVDNNAIRHLPIIDVNDEIRSESYKKAGVLTNYTKLTKEGLTGLVFRKPPVRKVPSGLDYIEQDVNGEGFTLTQFSQQIVGELLETGRCGILVDYPKVDIGLSLEETQNLNLKSRLKFYPAKNIINWNTRQVGSKLLISLVVLEECVNILADDGFDWIERVQFRVLELDAAGVYTQTIYDDTGRNIIEGPYQPTDYNGNVWYEIPFQFIGSENNDSSIDTIPLYDIAIVNLAHYRNSCDLEESIFLCGQPTTFISANGSNFNDAYPNGVKLGAHAYYCIGESGSAMMLQASPNSLVSQSMKDKEQQIVAIGARIITEAGGRETAEGARIRFGSQNSALFTITSNASLAIQNAIRWQCRYQGLDEDVLFNLNSQFYDETADPNLIAQQILLLERGIIAKNDIRDYARKTNFIDVTRTNEDLDSEALISSDKTLLPDLDNKLKQQEENNGEQ